MQHKRQPRNTTNAASEHPTPRGLWVHLQQLVTWRAAEEARLQASRDQYQQEAEQRFSQSAESIDMVANQEFATVEAEYHQLSAEVADEYHARELHLRTEFEALQAAAEADFESAVEKAGREYEEANWLLESVIDEKSDGSPLQKFDNFRSRFERDKEHLIGQIDELDAAHNDAVQLLRSQRMAPDAELPPHKVETKKFDELNSIAANSAQQVHQSLNRLRELSLPRQFEGWRPVIIAVVLPLVLVPLAIAVKENPLNAIGVLLDPAAAANDWIVISGGVALGVSVLLFLIFYLCARGQAMSAFHRLQQSLADFQAAEQKWTRAATDEGRRLREVARDWEQTTLAARNSRIEKAEARKQAGISEAENERNTRVGNAKQVYDSELQHAAARRDRRSHELEAIYPGRLQALRTNQNDQHNNLIKSMTSRLAESIGQTDAEWNRMSQRWHEQFGNIARGNAALCELHSRLSPPWTDESAKQWRPGKVVPPGVSIGSFSMRLNDLPNGTSADPRLEVSPTEFALPAMLAFPNEMSVTLEVDQYGSDPAVRIIQNTMLRLLTTIPPGKLRFTIVDPIGLGDNFSAFMHLADYDDVMVTSRIWTEMQHIEKRLADLTEHMENVFQTYLRNEYNDIREYNQQAGEVAEPFHFLVVANFPAGFSDEAARRLTSILSSGPRCGVHVLLSRDTRQALPADFNEDELYKNSTVLKWTGERFRWQDEALGNLVFAADPPPPTDIFSDVVRSVGDQSRDARHVEVGFERIAPHEDRIWTHSTKNGIDVPLGRAGATRLQRMLLGKGTSQHVLICGKTGSGKSTLLHILIANTALHYGPDEVEFYLIDFKKGVEFKTYAANRLPHARVIAIESDREFGLSVLERLDGVLRERGDRFRQHQVQDLAGFRDACPGEAMPRVMLVIDEFQEFFVDDDQIAQKASLLLDRLVRQGRAFGIHVLLGSQTLGGAYSLARSTLGQVAVRIALQCSETDAHLILSEENSAARLLSRPGDAIYNDANGMMEGNHPFQVAWLDEDRRERDIRALRERIAPEATERYSSIVFEGNLPADPANNMELVRRVQGERSSEKHPRVWLGEPVSIAEQTSITFRPQSGQNLLIVGRSTDLAQGILVMTALAIIGWRDSKTDIAQLNVFTADDEDNSPWNRLLPSSDSSWQSVTPRKSVSAIESLHAELKRREDADDATAPALFLVVDNLSRFRDLRRDEDDFGFGGMGMGMDEPKPVSAGKLFTEILRDGPAYGIHSIVWVDTWNNVSRWMAPQTVREFESRVAFQMNATDSSNLIDTPAAARLGNNRALLYRDDVGTTEKFRPYGCPDSNWLETPEPSSEADGPEESSDDTATMDDLDGWQII